MTDDARRTHWYANSSLWPFGPGQLIIIHTKFQAPEPSSSVVEDFLYILFLNPRPLLQDQPGPGKCRGGGGHHLNKLGIGHLTMLHSKDQKPGPFDFSQENCYRFSQYKSMYNKFGLMAYKKNNFGRGPLDEAMYQM